MTSDRWRKVERIYHSARQQDPGKREAFLEEACEGDESLRREVGSLLASRSEAEDFIESPAVEVAAKAMTEGRVAQHADLAGRTLLHYKILKQVGSGGMGDVYQAKDLSLGRDVAIKVLPGEFARDPDRISRFEREAKLLASLNHPHISAIYELGESGETKFLVLELLEGETLRSLISRGPVTIRKLLDIAAEITDGMAAAHAGGITHRDLKPANIMILRDGHVKILDFGLGRQSSAPAAAGSETSTISHTEPGMIVGTVHYMSPEQAGGKPVDYRSDQFSFGLILYEMASGKKAFDKPESVQTLSAILTEEAPPIERSIPAPLRWIIDRCLAKDPGNRYDSSRDLYQELRNLRDRISEASAPQAAAAAPRRMKWLIPAIAWLLGLGVALGAWLFFAPPPMPDQSAYRFTPFAFDPGWQGGGSWSPDGKAYAYTGRRTEANHQIFIRYLDSPVPVQVTHVAEGLGFLGWSSDSRRIYFRSARKPAGIWTVAAVGGEPEPFLSYSFLGNISACSISPDGKTLAVLRIGEDGRWGIWIGTRPDWKLKKYSPDPFASTTHFNIPSLGFSPDGKSILLFFNPGEGGRGEEAWLIPYPPDPRNPPRLVLRDLPRFGGTPNFSWMPDSRRIVLATQATPDGFAQLWLADVRSGRFQVLTSGTINCFAPAVSPDGQRMVFTEQSINFDVVSASLDGSPPRALVATERNELMPAWAAKQPVLVYVTNRNGPPEIWLREGDSDRPLVTARNFPPGTTLWFMAPALSPNADRVVYTRTDRNAAIRLWISSISGGSPTPLTNETAHVEMPGSWSPDGRWFCYRGVSNGKIYLMKVRTTGQAKPIVMRPDANVHSIPSWSPAGDWIAYGKELISPDGKTTRALGNKGSAHHMFSADGKLVYGIRRDGERNILFSVDIATGTEKVLGDLGKDFSPSTNLMPGIRFSLAPDGKSFVYGILKIKSNLWMLEGFEPKADLLNRLLPGWSK